MKEKTKIYKLIDPRDESVMYVGKTTESMSSKLNTHRASAKNRIDKRSLWIKELQSQGLAPKYDIIEYVEEEQWPEREEYWIKYYRKVNPKLCNLSAGRGMLGIKWNTKRREELSYIKSKPVYQLDTRFNILELHPSCKQASRNLGVKNPVNINIAARSRGKKSAYGFIWIYKQDYDMWKQDKIMAEYKMNRYVRKVSQYTKEGVLIKEWISTVEAADKLGIKSSGIGRAKIGERKTYKGFIWK